MLLPLQSTHRRRARAFKAALAVGACALAVLLHASQRARSPHAPEESLSLTLIVPPGLTALVLLPLVRR